MSKIIEIVVAATGDTTITTYGFVGPSCQEASRFLENALGKPSSEQLTSAYYQDVKQQQRSQVDS